MPDPLQLSKVRTLTKLGPAGFPVKVQLAQPFAHLHVPSNPFAPIPGRGY